LYVGFVSSTGFLRFVRALSKAFDYNAGFLLRDVSPAIIF
jgi:hypothetical protein